MKTTKRVIEESNISPKLIRSVLLQLGGRESLEDISRHGISGGFSGFIYYSETVAFYKRNRKDILALLKEYASDFGLHSAAEVVSGFNCLKGNSDLQESIGRCLYGRITDEDTMVANALAWFAAEEVARAFCDE
jgi:hypothetical protein